VAAPALTVLVCAGLSRVGSVLLRTANWRVGEQVRYTDGSSWSDYPNAVHTAQIVILDVAGSSPVTHPDSSSGPGRLRADETGQTSAVGVQAVAVGWSMEPPELTATCTPTCS